jgi:hypothetical protein
MRNQTEISVDANPITLWQSRSKFEDGLSLVESIFVIAAAHLPLDIPSSNSKFWRQLNSPANINRRKHKKSKERRFEFKRRPLTQDQRKLNDCREAKSGNHAE